MTSGSAPSGSEDSYLATVSDLVSSLIFIFIIMLAVFALQLANVTENLTASDDTRREIIMAIAHHLEGRNIRVEIVYDQGVLRLSDNAINFPSGDETPNPDHHTNVGYLAHALATVIPCYVDHTAQPPSVPQSQSVAPQYCHSPADVRDYDCDPADYPWLLDTLLIEGHTDSVPVNQGNRFRDNLELSSMRAATIHRMITTCEPTITKMRNTTDTPILSTSGYGSNRPVTSVDLHADRNRRIDLRFLLEPPPSALATSAADTIKSDVKTRYDSVAN